MTPNNRLLTDTSTSPLARSALCGKTGTLGIRVGMGEIGKALARALASLTLAFCAGVAPAHAQDRFSILKAVAMDIERLKADFPQLRDFLVGQHLHAVPPSIGYAFRTHASERTGGWTSGVPNPDADGIWFHIDLHDPGSELQLHTQPVTASLCLGNSRVSFLMLEGRDTRSVYRPIWSALSKQGARECAR